jgi:hypothetical protein
MADDVIQCWQRVAEGGYCWRQARPAVLKRAPENDYQWARDESKSPQRVLTPVAPGQDRTYNPLDHLVLFREYSFLHHGSQEDILAFANNYGLLVEDRFIPENSDSVILGDEFNTWTANAYAMNRCVEIWDYLTTGNVTSLLQRFQWRKTRWHYVWPFVGLSVQERLGGAIEPPKGIDFNSTDPRPPARLWLQQEINLQIMGHVSPRLLHELDLKGRFHGQILTIVPNHLLGALWLQFAQAIAGNKRHRSCRLCGRWFEISKDADARTVRRLFCSDSCKTLDYRKRKEQALALKAKGMAIKDIAREIHTNPATVRTWLKKGR